MLKIKFDCNGRHAPAYGCDYPGDNSDYYYRAADVDALVAKLKAQIPPSDKTETCMCWNCHAEYAFFYHRCPECGATNANVHFAEAIQEKEDKTLIRKPSNENHI
jgi:hypothetical protein